MFDLGWSELLVIGVIALIVIGPKDLPKALKSVGVWMRKARQISGEFRSTINEMVREAELDEVRQQVAKATKFDIEREFQKTVDPTGSLAEAVKPPELTDASRPPEQPPAAAAPPTEKPEAEPPEPAAVEPPKAAHGG
jgi:sec-independent protein translocase protein TatB